MYSVGLELLAPWDLNLSRIYTLSTVSCSEGGITGIPRMHPGRRWRRSGWIDGGRRLTVCVMGRRSCRRCRCCCCRMMVCRRSRCSMMMMMVLIWCRKCRRRCCRCTSVVGCCGQGRCRRRGRGRRRGVCRGGRR